MIRPCECFVLRRWPRKEVRDAIRISGPGSAVAQEQVANVPPPDVAIRADGADLAVITPVRWYGYRPLPGRHAYYDYRPYAYWDGTPCGNYYSGQQPPAFFILAARALSACTSGTSPKHLARHSNSLRWNGVRAGASE